jgi:hypothetical protein
VNGYTLSKGAAEIDDRTIETLLSQLPIRETLLSRWVGLDSGAINGDAKLFKAVLTIEPTPVLHTLTKIEALEPICVAKAPLRYQDSETGDVMYSRTNAVVATSSAPAAGNAISVSGQIVMPERKP